MRRVRCPYCGAVFEVPEGVEYAVCPYCGTVVEIEKGSRIASHYYPIRLEEDDARYAALSLASQMPGAPEDIASSARVTRMELHVVPLYVCRVSASCGELTVEREEGVLASREPLPGLTRGYRFPSMGREAYNPGVFGRVDRFHQVEVPASTACSTLAERLGATLSLEAMLAGCNTTPSLSSSVLGLAHYPFWLVEYEHPLTPKPLKAVVDAVDARVVYLEYPRSLAKRAMLAAISVAGLLLAAVLGTAAATIAQLDWPISLAPLASSLLAAGATVSPGLRRAASRIGVYTWSPQGGVEPRVRLEA